MCLCSQPTLTERTADDHRQPPARYGAMGTALCGRLATALLHHVGGHNLREPFTQIALRYAITGLLFAVMVASQTAFFVLYQTPSFWAIQSADWLRYL